ncbi:MAG: VOC family protein [Planctomycetota bacterium]
MLDQYGVTGIVLFVRDYERAANFYRESLGLDIAIHGEGEERFMMGQAGKMSLIFFETPEPKAPIPVFGLDDGGIDDVVARLIEQKAQIVTPVSHAPGGWTADFDDGHGNLLSLYQEADKPRKR